eukprot:4956549-Amphidinium_carterae.1
MLGVTVDFNGSDQGFVQVKNKETRVKELIVTLRAFLDKACMTRAEASSLRGRMLFADAQHYCRLGCVSSRAVGVRAAGPEQSQHITEELFQALGWFCRILVEAPVRSIPLAPLAKPVVIFTDGACEGPDGTKATIGGIKFDPNERPEFFAEAVPYELVRAWKADGSKQIIFLVELLPVLVAKTRWHASLQSRPVIFFIDNESARSVLVSCSTASQFAMRIVWSILELDVKSLAMNWYARVPSASNPADAPSRGAVRETADAWDALQVPIDMDCYVACLTKGVKQQ